MSATNWENTVVSNQNPERKSGCARGSLLQIHPTQVGNGLLSLPPEPFTIGRDEECDLTLADSAVSRRHATIEPREEGYLLSDCKSTNGTVVNDQRVDSHWLEAGDKIRIGNFILKFLDDNGIESQYHETIYQMATCDGLTGVFNKRCFLESLNREFERSIRHSRDLCLIHV